MKSVPTEIAALENLLATGAPALAIQLKAPFHETGRWWIELHRGHLLASLSWRAGAGFEFYPDEEPSFGLKPELVLSSAEQAYDHLRQTYPHWHVFGATKHSAQA